MTKLVFVANSTAAVTETIHDGKSYLVAPVVAIKEGVLNDLLYLSQDIGQYASEWNGHVIPVNHPMRGGEFVSANSLDIWAKEVIGNFWNVSLDGDKLKGDIWIDLAKAEKFGEIATNLVARLRAGEPIEVSTGVLVDIEPTAGVWNGKSYTGIARNIRPDHLALLPNEVGACSWDDGCGVPRVNMKGGLMPNEVKTNELTLDDRASLVRMAFWEQVRVDPYTEPYWDGDWDVISVFGDVLIAKDWNTKSHVAFPYTIDDNGVVTLGAPTPVEVAYQTKDGGAEVVVANADTAASAKPSLIARAMQWLKRDKTGSVVAEVQEQEEVDVKKCELVTALVANKAVKFSKEALDKWSEADLETLQASLVANEEAAPAPVVEAPAATPATSTPEWQQAMDALNGKIDALAGAITANADSEKAQLVSALVANEQNAFDEADLKAMSVDQLKKLASSLNVRDYSGAAGNFRSNSGDQETVLAMPKPVWAVAGEAK